MLYKLICAALLISSGEALKVTTGVSRRAAIAKAAAVTLPFAASMPAAFAELKRAGDAEIYKKADEGTLTATRAIERAKSGDLADGSSATVRIMRTSPAAAAFFLISSPALVSYVHIFSSLSLAILGPSSLPSPLLSQCEELDKLIAIDRESAAFEKEMLDIMDGTEKKDAQAVEKKMQVQVEKLKKKKKEKGCA